MNVKQGVLGERVRSRCNSPRSACSARRRPPRAQTPPDSGSLTDRGGRREVGRFSGAWATATWARGSTISLTSCLKTRRRLATSSSTTREGPPRHRQRSIEVQRQYVVYGAASRRRGSSASRPGVTKAAELKTELWLVPPGAHPPVEAQRAESEAVLRHVCHPPGGKDSDYSQPEEMGAPARCRSVATPSPTRSSGSPILRLTSSPSPTTGRAPGAWRRFRVERAVAARKAGRRVVAARSLNGGQREQAWSNSGFVPRRRRRPSGEEAREAAARGREDRDLLARPGNRRRRRAQLDARQPRRDAARRPQRVGCLRLPPTTRRPRSTRAGRGGVTPFDYVALAGECGGAELGALRHRGAPRRALVGRRASGGRVSRRCIVPKCAAARPAGIVKQREAR